MTQPRERKLVAPPATWTTAQAKILKTICARGYLAAKDANALVGSITKKAEYKADMVLFKIIEAEAIDALKANGWREGF